MGKKSMTVDMDKINSRTDVPDTTKRIGLAWPKRKNIKTIQKIGENEFPKYPG